MSDGLNLAHWSPLSQITSVAETTYLKGYAHAALKMAVRKDILSALDRLADDDQLSLLFELIAERDSSSPTDAEQKLNVKADDSTALRTRGSAVVNALSESENGLSLSDIASRFYDDKDQARKIKNARSLMHYLQHRVTIIDGSYYLLEKAPPSGAALETKSVNSLSDASISELLERMVSNSAKGLTTIEAYEELRKGNPKLSTSKEYVSVALNRLEGDNKIKSRPNRTSRRGRKIYFARANGGATK